MKKITLSAIAAFTLVSCSTTNHTYRASAISNQGIIANQVVVDTKIDINKKVEAISSKRNTANEAIDEAYYRAIVDNKIDVVVDPIFEVTTTDKFLFWGGKSYAKISGLGAKYENSRSKIEAIKELKSVDENDIKKFNAVYQNNSLDSKVNIPTGPKKSLLASLPIIGFLFS